GGKDLKTEQERITRMNILVCTPGRLLQHMDQTPNFDCSNLQVLALDEADRILDLGFAKTLNAIIENLPKHRQTMLFSATQTKSVKDLARLSLQNPEYIAVHDKSDYSTPKQLQQHYMVTELPGKLDMLFSFMKTHLQCKAIVFLSSCKQVRFVFETFCKLQPGVPLMQLHGKQKQQKRVDIFTQFSRTKHAYLFCTDVAARGLDFPAVDWVLQVDCPEDADTYIHRVGRTARYDLAGRALLFLLPSEEEAMVELLKKKRVPIEKIRVKQSRKQSIQQQMQAFCFKDPEIKYLGQKTFVSYVRSVYLQRNKDVFDVSALPLEEYAASLGLPGAPRIRFVKSSAAASEESGSESDASESEEKAVSVKQKAQPKSKIDRMFQRKNQSILADHYTKLVDQEGDRLAMTKLTDAGDDDDDFMTLKRVDHDLDDDTLPVHSQQSKRSLRKTKKEIVKTATRGEKLLFDDEGEAHPVYEFEALDDFMKEGSVSEKQRAYVEKGLAEMRDADAADRATAREKRREKRQKRKQREREVRGNDDDGDFTSSASLRARKHISSGSDSEESDVDAHRRSQKPSKKRARIMEVAEPTTLEDQERLALQLLGAL
ncbi:P-loop containing nucleoside triphosphate hydrolase protein, partial [Thamnocephalis sphaerospora]